MAVGAGEDASGSEVLCSLGGRFGIRGPLQPCRRISAWPVDATCAALVPAPPAALPVAHLECATRTRPPPPPRRSRGTGSDGQLQPAALPPMIHVRRPVQVGLRPEHSRKMRISTKTAIVVFQILRPLVSCTNLFSNCTLAYTGQDLLPEVAFNCSCVVSFSGKLNFWNEG